ncbi:phosphate ABC transporter permease PstA [Chromohalobacter canadensis]|uniref:Phosphate transport system permease protein PstA n=1 Tax=Chromohalobacter canadensis TaxID=141389 RepID=A0ABZ0Y9G7_9GAMM|nr:phosphate ABC transporter permease PstA [Chromohalobacter canadensis]MCK0768309.1 phosphate ABC transporter permease PstA [Chromohalobacter canadensis]WQH08710.1 phosphate ABC transporter permease PstA [Chromohalobacter canadensis]
MSQSFEEISAQLKKRHRRSARMKWMTMGALILSAAFLVVFISDMVVRGWPAFQQAQIQVEVSYDEQSQELPLAAVDEDVRPLISRGFFRPLPRQMEDNPALMGTTQTQWVIADSRVDQFLKGNEDRLRPADKETLEALVEEGRAALKFNTTFFTTGDSKMPELAGIASAAIGTVMTMLVTMAVCFPIGVMTAVYLEEFAPDNRLTQLIEININNLAAVPSILFGLLGLAIYISFFGVPRSSPLVGGLTLALMTLPVIIISTRAALRSVPDSIRHAAFGVGCSRWQVVRDHVLPVSLPGILTGSIIGLAQAMGETAPLIIVGMVAFIPDASVSITDASTVMPAQIFTWASEPNSAFAEKTAGGILVLLAVLIFLNALAVWLRNKFERRW